MERSTSLTDSTIYTTAAGLTVSRFAKDVDRDAALADLRGALDTRRGALFSSGYEFPGRYSRWDLGFVNPPLCISAAGRRFSVEALNARGEVLLVLCERLLRQEGHIDSLCAPTATRLDGLVRAATDVVPEEYRSRQPSFFSVLRSLVGGFASPEDAHLGFYGAFGYDLCFQFESVRLCHERQPEQRDAVLYLPDRLLVVDRQKGRARRYDYEFTWGELETRALPPSGMPAEFRRNPPGPVVSDHGPGEYAAKVAHAREAFQCGDLFELVLSQTFRTPCSELPSTLFHRLERRNPAPFAFLLNLGQHEHLVGASPEMFVRVQGRRVETCPISGTVPRGEDALEDALRVRELLNSAKDESELTMCTDVDRNDKARICEPGSVRVLGRRQIEMYSRLIHTVDHVEGVLRSEFDALDAFQTHAWAVTVTGAPKPAAIRRIERDESSPRRWYGGAVGVVGFDGSLNTGLTLRTLRLADGVAEVRAGATLLYDSSPEAEELETRLKASALLEAVLVAEPAVGGSVAMLAKVGGGRKVLLVDHEDSFVHMLADYFRQTGAVVVTRRSGFGDEVFKLEAPDLVVLSPGPGRPRDFALAATIAMSLRRGVPIFGVCLGLQGIVEYFGGDLAVLPRPVHGKPSEVLTDTSALFEGLPPRFMVGRYHSLVAVRERLPRELRLIARTVEGHVMAVEHSTLPISAVQFHPESLLTSVGEIGLRLVRNVVTSLCRGNEPARSCGPERSGGLARLRCNA